SGSRRRVGSGSVEAPRASPSFAEVLDRTETLVLQLRLLENSRVGQVWACPGSWISSFNLHDWSSSNDAARHSARVSVAEAGRLQLRDRRRDPVPAGHRGFRAVAGVRTLGSRRVRSLHLPGRARAAGGGAAAGAGGTRHA